MKSVSSPATPFQRKHLRFLLAFLAFAGVFSFLFWKCPYGFCNMDEAFYITIPYRLYMGDALFVEEWNLSLMSGVLTYPFVAGYLHFAGTTEGILLYMRYVYTTLQCMLSLFLFFRLRKLHWFGALAASVSFALYAPFGIMALSYNSMAIMLLTLSCVIILTAQTHTPVQFSLAGLSFAGAVLCNPYLMLVYGIYLCVVAGFLVYRRKTGKIPPLFCTVKGSLLFTSGAFAAAVLFAVFVFSRGSLSDILRSFPSVLNDPSHSHMGLLSKTIEYVQLMLYQVRAFTKVYAALALVMVLHFLDKKRSQHTLAFSCLLGAAALWMMYSYWDGYDYINHTMWSVNVIALMIQFFTRNKTIRRIFYLVWIPGILLSYCQNAISNQLAYAIFSAASVSTVGSILIIALYFQELIDREALHGMAAKAVPAVLMCAVLLTQICLQAHMRYHCVFWEDGMDTLTVQINDGIEKGIIASEEKYAMYNDALSYLETVKEYGGRQVLYLSENSWYYLQGQQEIASYSAWLSGVSEHSLARLEVYYQINPHKLPDVVFVDSAYPEMAQQFCTMFSYVPEEINGGYILLPA